MDAPFVQGVARRAEVKIEKPFEQHKKPKTVHEALMVGSKVRLGVGDAFGEPVPLKLGETPTPPSPRNSRPITEKGFGSGWRRPTNIGEEKGEKPKYKPFRPSGSEADAAIASLPAQDAQHQTVLEGQSENLGVRLGWGEPTSE